MRQRPSFLSQLRLSFYLLGVLFICSGFSEASMQMEAEDVIKFELQARVLGTKYGPENVLLAYDIDNTLLAANQPLGSDAWFGWQVSLLGTNDRRLVAPDIDGIISVQGLLYALDRMHPPDAYEPSMVKKLQEARFPSIVLTARGPQTHDSTLKHFENYYDFSKSPLAPDEGYPGQYLPYEKSHVADYGLRPGELAAFHLNNPRAVSYTDGVFMTNGQHKGAMLRTLLKKTGQNVKAIVFLDDMKKNCDAVYNAFQNTPYEVVTVRYSKEDETNKRFPSKTKEVDEAWQEVKGMIEKNFPN